jgi:PAS domain S-box-containing protein
MSDPADPKQHAQVWSLVDQLPVALWSTDTSLRFTSGRGGGLAALGLRPDQLKGVSLHDFFGTRDEDQPAIRAHRGAVAGSSSKYELHWAGRWYETYVEPFRDAAGNIIGALAMAIDTTARNQAEEAQRSLLAKLRQQHKLEAIGQLARGLAHEINNPLQAISNFAHLIQGRADDTPLRDYSQGIAIEVQRLAAIVRNLQCLVHQKGDLPVELKLCDMVEGTLSLFATLLHDEGIQLEVAVPDELPAAWGNAYGIQQIFINLLTTARDALGRLPQTDIDPKRIRVGAALVDLDAHRFVRLSVEHRHLVGEACDAAGEPSSSPDHAAAELGLTLSHEIANYNAGRLNVEIGPDDTRSMQLFLPLASEQ